MLKQTLMALWGLGWVKLLALTTAVVVPVGAGTYFYLHQASVAPSSAPTTSTSQPSSFQSQNPASAPKSESKPTATAPKPTTPTVPKPAVPSTPAQTPAPATPPAQAPTQPAPPSSSACTNYVWSSSNFHGSWNTNGYLVENNVWNDGEAGPQSIYACAWNNWYIVSNQPGSGTDDSVKSYPATKKIVDIPLNNMNTVTSSWSVATPSAGGQVSPNSKQWNTAYDIWLDNYSTEVMVWNNWTANWQYWYGVYHGVDVTIDGVAYHAYYDGSDVMWFVRAGVANSGTVNLKAILQWAVGQGWLQNNQRINQIEYGFEVMYTGTPTRFDLLNYSLTAN